jgi:twitching motility protein PilT
LLVEWVSSEYVADTVQAVQNGSRLDQILGWCEELKASDLHGQAGEAFTVRVDGQLRRLNPDEFPPFSSEELYEELSRNFKADIVASIRRRNEFDMSFRHGSNRYRANFSKQKGEQSFSFRFVPQQRFGLKDLHLPDSLQEIVEELRGLVLLTGPTAQGKSTTARALLQQLNETSRIRIITIEDPVEYVFKDEKAQFEQREVGIDTDSFANGIRNAMRQDPNLIFVGEMRDRESIYAAVQAAETGHMVITTLHADSAPQALGRIRMFYPMNEQENISALLARNLKAIVTQRLVPSTLGPRIPCLEVLRVDRGAQEAIANNELHLLEGIIESAIGQGMHSFDQYLIELLAAEQITEETAKHFAVNRHRLELMLRGIISHRAILRLDRVT